MSHFLEGLSLWNESCLKNLSYISGGISDWSSNTAQWILVKEVWGMYRFAHWIRRKYHESYLLEWTHCTFISVYNMLKSDIQPALHCEIMWLFAVSLMVYWSNLYIYLYKVDVLVSECSVRGICFQVYFSIYFNWGEIFLRTTPAYGEGSPKTSVHVIHVFM
jgi:hypothetical protein